MRFDPSRSLGAECCCAAQRDDIAHAGSPQQHRSWQNCEPDRPAGKPLGGSPEFSALLDPDSVADEIWSIPMQTHAAIRTASPRQPAAQAPNGPLPRGRPSADVIELMGTVMPFARNSEIYGENEPAEYLYKVMSGN